MKMKTKIKIILCLIVLIFAKPALCQHDTIIYTGINGRLTGPENSDIRKAVNYKSSSKIEIQTYRKTGKAWKKINTEQMTLVNSKSTLIRSKGKGVNGFMRRDYEKMANGSYKFSDYTENKLMKTGYSLLKIPVILNGEVTEYYDNGNLKSKSVYRNNELLVNKNWLENGDKYIDSIFYSVDDEPLLSGGNALIHQHVRQAFINTGLDFSSVSGSLLLGFVVMETGTIAGIRVIKGISTQVNNIAVFALETLDGKWKPAQLNGKAVRYFQLFPINFIREEENKFDYMEFDGTMIHYNIK